MAIYQRCVHGVASGMVWNIVKVAQRIRLIQIYCGSNKSVLQTKARCYYLKTSASSECLACHRFNRAYWYFIGMIPEKCFKGVCFCNVITWHSVSVRADIIYLFRSHLAGYQCMLQCGDQCMPTDVSLNNVLSLGCGCIGYDLRIYIRPSVLCMIQF